MIEGWGLAAAAVVAGGAVAGAAISANASSNAAQAQQQASMNATQAQLSMFNTTQADYAPQIQLGQGAANLLAGIYGTANGGNGTPNYAAFDNSPGYKFSVQQGQSAINRQAAASGNLYSTNTLAALGNYTQGAASTQYNSYINQLLSMAGLGNAASSGVGTAATATGGEIGANMNLGGSAAAAGILGQGNAFSNAIGSGNSGISGALASYLNGTNNSNSMAYPGNPTNPYNLGGSSAVYSPNAPAQGGILNPDGSITPY